MSKNVVILGGGFAGIECAIALRKKRFNVTLVSDRDYFYIYPTSIWVPTGKVSFDDVSMPLEDISTVHGFELIIDEVEAISIANQSVTLKSGKVLADYDTLVLAMGAGKMKHNGIDHTYSICGRPTDALVLKEKIEALVEKKEGKIAFGFGGNPKDTSAVRGGPGFELLFNVHNHLKKKGIRDNFELVFFAPMKEPGKRMGEGALNMMDRFFKRLNITKVTGKKIKQFESHAVVLEDDSRIEADLIMYIPANNGHDVVINSDLPQNEAGFITINDYCEVQGCDNVYAIGDVAALEGPAWRAKQGHIAEVMARNCAYNIEQKMNASAKRKGYQQHLNILCVMDSGDGAMFVYRDDKRAHLIPMPVVGHWLKRGWGRYCKLTKLGKFPKLPGL